MIIKEDEVRYPGNPQICVVSCNEVDCRFLDVCKVAISRVVDMSSIVAGLNASYVQARADTGTTSEPPGR